MVLCGFFFFFSNGGRGTVLWRPLLYSDRLRYPGAEASRASRVCPWLNNLSLRIIYAVYRQREMTAIGTKTQICSAWVLFRIFFFLPGLPASHGEREVVDIQSPWPLAWAFSKIWISF